LKTLSISIFRLPLYFFFFALPKAFSFFPLQFFFFLPLFFFFLPHISFFLLLNIPLFSTKAFAPVISLSYQVSFFRLPQAIVIFIFQALFVSIYQSDLVEMLYIY